MSVHLLDHIVDAGEEVLASFMVARNVLCGGSGGLVAIVGGGRAWKERKARLAEACDVIEC